MDRHPRACWFAAIPGAQKAKDVEDCLKNTAAPPLKPYSHNIIAITLKIIEEKFGEEESIRMMKECHLDKHGWCIPKQKKSLNEIIYGTNFP